MENSSYQTHRLVVPSLSSSIPCFRRGLLATMVRHPILRKCTDPTRAQTCGDVCMHGGAFTDTEIFAKFGPELNSHTKAFRVGIGVSRERSFIFAYVFLFSEAALGKIQFCVTTPNSSITEEVMT